MNIVIVGAGIAGLTAGRALKALGHGVTVLEARGSTGGRIWTDRSFTGFPIERGAEFIHGSNVITWEFIQMMHAQTLPVGSFPDFFYEYEGRLLSYEELCMQPGMGDAFTMNEHALADRDPLLKDVSLHTWANGLQIAQHARVFMESYIARLNLAASDAIGINDLANEARLTQDGEGDARIRGGYDTLVDFMAQNLDIRLNDPVTHIEYGKKNTVRTAAGKVFDADAVIVTVPLSILQKRKIDFIPPLPAGKLAAIDTLSMGDALKVHLQFSKTFWNEHAALYIGQGDIFTVELPSRFRQNAAPVINAFIVGRTARAWSKLSEKEMIDRCLSDICRMFQSETPRNTFEKGMCSIWSNEPWIEGGYSYAPVGSYGARSILAEPVGNSLFFAGEATVFYSNPATVSGAIESGLRAAGHVTDRLNLFSHT